MELNIQAMDLFLKGEKVEGKFGDKDLGRDFVPKIFTPVDMTTW